MCDPSNTYARMLVENLRAFAGTEALPGVDGVLPIEGDCQCLIKSTSAVSVARRGMLSAP
jgi:hypothetical protein